MRQNSGTLTPDQSLWWKNSFLRRPKKPSIAELSGVQPLADMLLTSPFSSQIAIQPGQR